MFIFWKKTNFIETTSKKKHKNHQKATITCSSRMCQRRKTVLIKIRNNPRERLWGYHWIWLNQSQDKIFRRLRQFHIPNLQFQIQVPQEQVAALHFFLCPPPQTKNTPPFLALVLVFKAPKAAKRITWWKQIIPALVIPLLQRFGRFRFGGTGSPPLVLASRHRWCWELSGRDYVLGNCWPNHFERHQNRRNDVQVHFNMQNP